MASSLPATVHAPGNPSIVEDFFHPISIWNDLKPQPVVYSVSDVLPLGLGVAVICTVLHFILDRVFHPKAVKYANSEVPRPSQPEWIPSDLKELSFDKIQWHNPKIFQKTVAKKYPQFTADQLRQLVVFQKSCNAHSKHISKYQEAVFKVLVFGAIYFYGLGMIAVDGQWFWDQKWMWNETRRAFPQSLGDHPVFNLRTYYYLQIGYALHRAYYQCFEHIRRDFWAMFVHHWVTAALLVGGHCCGFAQYGAVVLLCNDNCDLLMPLGKLCSYAGWRTAEMVFTVAFCVLWIPFRIGIYGYKVIYSISVDGYDFLRPYPVNWLCFLGLLIIYLLQFFWTRYLLQMLRQKLWRGRGIVDVRSDDEDAIGIGGDRDAAKKRQ